MSSTVLLKLAKIIILESLFISNCDFIISISLFNLGFSIPFSTISFNFLAEF